MIFFPAGFSWHYATDWHIPPGKNISLTSFTSPFFYFVVELDLNLTFSDSEKARLRVNVFMQRYQKIIKYKISDARFAAKREACMERMRWKLCEEYFMNGKKQ